MGDAHHAKAPVHLWIVGLLSLIWNSFGCYDYFETRSRNTEYLSSMMPNVDPNATLAWIDSFPIWAQFGWALGVWGGLIGSILLLVRSRWAVLAFGLSLVGAVLSLGYQMLASTPPTGMDSGATRIMPLVIIAIAACLYYYALRQRRAGVLH